MSDQPDDIEREEGLSSLYDEFKEQYSLDMNQEINIDMLISVGETSSIDFKKELELKTKNKKSNFLKDVCSIANSAKTIGFLIIGVTDDKEIVGSNKISEEQIQSICYRYISPRINIEHKNINHNEKSIGIIQIDPTGKPFEISKDIEKLKQHDVFIRCGTTNQKASAREIIEMGKWSELNNKNSNDSLY